MAKITLQSNPKVRQIQNDLELYLEFCADYGYKYDEATLDDMRSYVFQQFSKYMSGKNFKDQWATDAQKFGILLK
jgi:hypothetical protein